MLFKSFAAVLSCVAVARAHFRLQFPQPRGVFVADQEPNFCGGYPEAVSNRSTFPLNGGFITLTSGHPEWTVGVLISVEQNPTNFSVFNKTTAGDNLPFVVPFFEVQDPGAACIPVDIGKLGIKGVGNGSNVTIQVMVAGHDGNLFQCSDLTLSDSFNIPSDVNCTTVRDASSASSTATSPNSTQGSGNGASTLHWSTGASLIAFAVALGFTLL